MAVAVKLTVPLEPPEMIQMVKPEITEYADIEDYFAALDEYFEASVYGFVAAAV